MNITKASEVLGFRVEYLRKLVKDGKISPKMVPVKEGGTNMRYDFTEDQLKAFKELPRHQVRRADGRSKYVIYCTDEESDELAMHQPQYVDPALFHRAPTHKPKPKPKPSLPKAE